MDTKHKDMLLDFEGFIAWAIKHKQSAGFVCATMGHDIGHLLNGEPGEVWGPRTFGYRKHLPSIAHRKHALKARVAIEALRHSLTNWMEIADEEDRRDYDDQAIELADKWLAEDKSNE